MKRLLTIFASLLLLCGAQAQQDSGFALVRVYSGDIADAAIDNLQNLYILSSKGQIRKFNAAGDSTGIYNQVRNFGPLYSLDVSNPLRPVLFYKDFSSVVILDRFLAVRTTLDLRRAGILQPGAAGLSYDNRLWVFDELENKLKKVDESGNLLMETPDFRNLFAETIRPQKIIDDNGMVYLADSAKGVYIFDNYGTFKKRVQLRNWQHVAVKEQYLIQTSPTGISVWDTRTYKELKRPYPATFQPYKRSLSTQNRFITFSTDSLRVYEIRL